MIRVNLLEVMIDDRDCWWINIVEIETRRFCAELFYIERDCIGWKWGLLWLRPFALAIREWREER